MIPLTLRRHHPAPAFEVRDMPGDTTIRLRDYSFRSDLLLFILHGPDCPHCVRIAQEMAERREDWEGWGASLLVLHTGDTPFPDAFFRQGHDEGGATLRRYCMDETAEVAIAVIEHRGRLMDGWSLRHPAPVDWHEVAETVRWVAVQEPECGACHVLPEWDEALNQKDEGPGVRDEKRGGNPASGHAEQRVSG